MIVVPSVVPSGAAGGQRFCYLCDWSDVCVLPVLLPVLAEGSAKCCTVAKILPVLRRFASFETGVANDLATTFRCNSNDHTPILPICQFCSDCQELSEFSYIERINSLRLANLTSRCSTLSFIVHSVLGQDASHIGKTSTECTIDRVANMHHNEGDGPSIFSTPSLHHSFPRLATTTLPQHRIE